MAIGKGLSLCKPCAWQFYQGDEANVRLITINNSTRGKKRLYYTRLLPLIHYYCSGYHSLFDVVYRWDWPLMKDLLMTHTGLC